MKYLTVFIVFLSLTVQGQEKINFGDFDKKYLQMTHCPVDSSAGAFYINDYGVSWLRDSYEMEFQYHATIKIINKDKFDLANIKIRHSNDDRVSKFKASTYNFENGSVQETKMKRNEGLLEKVNSDINSFNFSFPDVKEGSIIEYTYTITSGDLTRLKTWYFQGSIPVLKSQYEVLVPNYFEYERLLQGYHSLYKAGIDLVNRPFAGQSVTFQHHNYIATNVPAFKREAFITTSEDYISKIEFELKKYQFPGQMVKTYLPKSYSALALDMYESDYWHGSITNSKFTSEVVEVMKNNSDSKRDLAEAIFYFVRDDFTEDNDSDFPTVRKAFNERKGTSSQMNRILGAMLHEAGFEVNLVRISTRNNGNVNKFVPLASQFNFTIIKVKFDEEEFILDASDKNTPFEALPKYCLNGSGLVIGPVEEWVELNPFEKNSITYSGEFELIDDGYLEGIVTIRRTGYEAWEFKDDLDDGGVDDYKESFFENRDTWEISDHEIGEMESGYIIDEKIEVEIEDKMDDLGDIVYLNPIIVGQVVDNIFKTEDRVYPVNFAAPFTITHLYKFKLNDEFIVDELPAQKSIALPNKGGRLLYSASNMNNEITVTYRLQISKSEYQAEEYPYLREFYAQIVEKHGQQIVLRRK